MTTHWKHIRSAFKNASPGGRRFVLRVLVLLGLYTLIVIVHPTITSALHGYRYGLNDWWILLSPYPLFLLFIFYRWHIVKTLPLYRISKAESFLFSLLALAILIFPVNQLGTLHEIIPNLLLLSTFSISFFFLFFALVGATAIRYFLKETITIAGLYLSYTIAQLTIKLHWEAISTSILTSLSKITPLVTDEAIYNLDYFTVGLNNFILYIGPVCAGAYSIVTFAFLYIIVLIWLSSERHILYGRATLAGIVGVIALYYLNILRVAIILFIGGYVSHELAFQLFHEYMGAIFLALVFMLYLYKVIPIVTKPLNT